MICVYIYLENQEQAETMMEQLLKQGLAAHASVDFNNKIFFFENDQMVRKTKCLITLQTKALLFNQIVDLVHRNYGENTKIYSLPITQTNEAFSDFIRENTMKI